MEKENEVLAIRLVEILVEILAERLNKISPNNYQVEVKKIKNSVIFRIKRRSIPGRSDFIAHFILFATADSVRHRQIFEIRKYEKDKLTVEEYRELNLALIDFFEGYQIVHDDFRRGE